MLVGIELTKNNKPIVSLKNKEIINYFIMKQSLKMGVHLRPLGNIILLVPPLGIGKTDLDKLLIVTTKLLRRIEKSCSSLNFLYRVSFDKPRVLAILIFE